MASIVIPSRFYGLAPSQYFFRPNDWVVPSNPWGSGGSGFPDVFYSTPPRCRCPVHSPARTVTRRRVIRGDGDDILGAVADLLRDSFPQGCCASGDLFGIPAEYVRLIDILTNGHEGEKHQHPSDKNSKDEGEKSTCKGAGCGRSCDEGRDAACGSCPPENGSEKEEESPKSSSSPTTDKPASSSGEVAKPEVAVKKADEPFSLSIKIGDYRPEEVDVSVSDGRRVIVRAKRDQEDDGGRWVGHSEVEYSFLVPENTPTDHLTSSFGVDGLLSITAMTTPMRTDEEGRASADAAVEMGERSEQTTEVGDAVSVADDKEAARRDTSVDETHEEEEEAEVESELEAEVDVENQEGKN